MKASRLESDEESEFKDEDIAMIAKKIYKILQETNWEKKFLKLEKSKGEEWGNYFFLNIRSQTI